MEMELDRRHFVASIGGATAIEAMSDEAKADALEEYQQQQLNAAVSGSAPEKFPTAAEVEAQIETRSYRRGVGNLLLTTVPNGKMKRLPPLPAKPTLLDFFNLRMESTANHVLQSAKLAQKNSMSEEIILACLLHDTVQSLIKTDHGWWGAQLYEPYVSDKVSFAIKYHQALRFYADPANGYEYPDLYRQMFGIDYKPLPHIEAAYKFVRNHKWYLEPRLVTVNDLYAFDPNEKVSIEPFIDIIGRHFKQPKEGLGNDNSPSAHMWRTIANPDLPL